MAKKENRFAHKAEQTRRIKGRHVHAKKDETLRLDHAVIEKICGRNPDADQDWFEEVCRGREGLSGVLKLVRAGAIK